MFQVLPTNFNLKYINNQLHGFFYTDSDQMWGIERLKNLTV
jgi:hypothetical protein